MGRNKLTLNEKKILRSAMIRNKLPMSREREYQLFLVKNKRLYVYDQQSSLDNDEQYKNFIFNLISDNNEVSKVLDDNDNES